MNIDQALELSLQALHDLNEEFRDLKEQGVIEHIIAGAGGAGVPPDVEPDVGIQLSVDVDDFKAHTAEIIRRSQPVKDRGVRVVVFPKPPS